MSKAHSIPLVSYCTVIVGALFVVYIALIATVMTYASLAIEFSQSIKNDESRVAKIEAEYLAEINTIIAVDYASEGYKIPSTKRYVPAKSVTALR